MLSPAQMATRDEKQKAKIIELKEKLRAAKGAKLSTRTASTKANGNGNGKTSRAKTTKARPKARRASTRSVSASA